MRGLRVAIAIAVAGSLALGAVSLAPAQERDLSGTWSLTLVAGGPEEPTRGTLRLEQEGEALAGVWTRDDLVGDEMDVSGTVEGNTVRLSWETPDGATTSLIGEVREAEGDVMAGTFEVDAETSGEWTARRGERGSDATRR